jgi:hypothetical protein
MRLELLLEKCLDLFRLIWFFGTFFAQIMVLRNEKNFLNRSHRMIPESSKRAFWDHFLSLKKISL